MVTPAAHREAAAYLQSTYEMSQRRASRVIVNAGVKILTLAEVIFPISAEVKFPTLAVRRGALA